MSDPAPVSTYSRVPPRVRVETVEVFAEHHFDVSLWHGGAKVQDRFGYVGRRGLGYAIGCVVKETRDLMAVLAVDEASSLRFRLAHSTTHEHRTGSSTLRTEVVRKRHLHDFAGPMPARRTFAFDMTTRYGFEGLVGLDLVADVEREHPFRYDVGIGQGLLWAGYGFEGVARPLAGRFERNGTGAVLTIEGTLLFSVPDRREEHDVRTLEEGVNVWVDVPSFKGTLRHLDYRDRPVRMSMGGEVASPHAETDREIGRLLAETLGRPR